MKPRFNMKKDLLLLILKFRNNNNKKMIKESLKVARGLNVVRVMTVVRPAAMRSFTGNTKVLDEKEKGDERLFFKRQEGRFMPQF